MEGNHKSSRGRKLQRCYQCNRFEEELLALAYGELWPLIRKALTDERSADAEPKRLSSERQLKIGA